MNTFSTVVKFFQDCGLFIYPSLLIMALGLAIAIERFLFLQRARPAGMAIAQRRDRMPAVQVQDAATILVRVRKVVERNLVGPRGEAAARPTASV